MRTTTTTFQADLRLGQVFQRGCSCGRVARQFFPTTTNEQGVEEGSSVLGDRWALGVFKKMVGLRSESTVLEHLNVREGHVTVIDHRRMFAMCTSAKVPYIVTVEKIANTSNTHQTYQECKELSEERWG